MAASGEYVKALVRSHVSGDDEGFYAVALQVASREAQQGHSRLAGEIKQLIDAARAEPVARNVTTIAQPRGDLAELVTASFPDVGLRDFVAEPELLSHLRQILNEQRQRGVLQQHGYVPIHRVLLEGPPGTGKTMTASVLAHELGLPLLTVRLDSLVSKFMGETASKLRILFDAIEQQRAVYLFDEFDALGTDRSANDVGEARRILNSFLVFLEGATSESLLLAATNHRSILDPALFRRFDLVLDYHLPSFTQALSVMKARLGTLGRGLRWQSLAGHTDGLSHAELVKAVETAAKRALMRGEDKIVMSDLRDALDGRRTASRG